MPWRTLLAGPIAGLIAGALMQQAGWADDAIYAAGVTVWVVVWWITEPVPIPATSLLPLAP